jgi:cysteine-rich repeat protein
LCPQSITSITAAGAPFSNCYSPEDSFAPLSGTQGDGLWKFQITDGFEAEDDGTLDQWTLALCVGPAPVCGNGTIDFGETCDDGNSNDSDGCASVCLVEQGYTCTGQPSMCAPNACGDGNVAGGEECDDGDMMSGDGCSATCTIEPDATCTGNNPSVCSFRETICNDNMDNDGDGMTDGADSDCALPAYVPACATGETLRVYRSGDTPLAIPDADPSGIFSTINVGATATVTKVSLVINATHTWDADMDSFLISPAGTTVEISTDNGGSGDNYTDAVFSAGCPTVIGAAAPFSACYAPEGDLSTVSTGSPQGAWQLNVLDDLGDDIGTLQNWAIVFCTQ